MAKSTTDRPDETSPLLQPPSSEQAEQTEKSWMIKCVEAITPSQRNKGMILILTSEVVGASMDATARFLQQGNGRAGGKGISVFQVSI